MLVFSRLATLDTLLLCVLRLRLHLHLRCLPVLLAILTLGAGQMCLEGAL